MNKQVKRQKLFQIPAFLLAVLVALNVCVPIGYAGSPAPDVFTTKSFDNLPPLSMRDVAYGNSIYVAVGDKGTVVRSTDAEHWEVVIDRTNVVSYTGVSSPDDISFTGAAYGNGLFVISGSKGVILTSPDAQTWTKRDSGVTSDFTLADYFTLNGNGAFYVLSQGKYMTSTNGIDWTSVTPTGLASDRTLTQMTLGNNGTKLAFAADTGVIYYTANGSSWANVTPTSPDGSNFFRWMGNRYLFINIGGQILSSTDLTSFSSLGAGAPSAENSAGYLRMRTGLYDGQNYYLVGSQDGIAGITYKSSDGTTWTKQPFEREITTQNAEFLNGKYFMFGNEGMSISDTGSNWQYKWGQNFRDVAYNGSTYVAVGNTGQEGDIWSSSDLVNWTERTPNGFPGIFSAVAYGNGKYVAVSSPYQKETQIATSSDGLTWTLHQRPNQNETWKDIIFANGVFVAGQDSNILTSTDGLTWTTANVPTAFDSIVSIVYENNQFIALASESGAGKIYTSANGSAWLDRSSDYVNSSANSIDAFTGIVYDGSKYVLIGVETVSYMQFSRTSDDLTNWSSISLTGDSSLFETQSVVVAKGSDLYVLGVDSWTGLYTLYSSVNQGTNWQPTSSIPENANVYALKKINNEVIISGGSKFLKATGGVSSSLIAPVTAAFDKKTSAQADVEVTATWNGNTLGSITNGGTPLTADTDYTVVNNTVTIKKSYLTLQAIGATNLVFNFSAGNTQTLTVNVSDTTPQNSQIAPVTAAFDKKTSAQADVEVTATWNGNTLGSITNGGTPLTADTDYTVVNNTVTIKKSYLALQAVGATNLVFNFSAGNTQTLTVNVSDTTPQNSQIAPVTAAFDKKTSAQADVEVTATWNGNTLSSITNGGTPLTADTDYTVVNNTVTIKKSYLTLQAIGATNLVFNFSAGNTQTLTVNVSDTTPQNSQIAPVTAAFDKKTSAQADVEVTATWNGNTLSSITNGGTPLTADTDYTVVNNTVTIKKSYLALQAVGSTNLVFNFSAGNTQTLTVNVSDTTPPSSQDSQLSTATAAFDKKVSAQADVSVNLTLNGNTFTGITNNGIPLLQDTDYTVAGSTVTINKTYLAQQPVGKTNLLFNFSAGISPALEVTISDTTPPSPQDSELSLQTAGFDKETSAQADVAVTLTLNGNTLNSIANNGTPLALNSDYTVVGDVVTINKSYLSQQPIGTTNLTFNFSAGAAKTLAVTVSDSTPPSPQDSQLSTSTAVFDKKVAAQADVNVTLTLNGNTLSSITNGGLPLLENTDYTLSGNAVTIGKSYLAQQPTGATNLVFNFSAGSSQLLTVTVSDSTPPNPQDSQLSTLTAVFDKKSTQQNDVTVVLNLNGNTFSGIANNGTPLVLGTDYTLAGDTVTINKSYLALQPVGTTNLAFNFSAGAAKTLTVTISDTTTEGVPAAPTRIVATAGDRQATVTFTPPTDNGGSPITGYEVLNSNEQVVATGTSSPIVVTGLTNGASYVFTVKALNTVGKSNVSLPSNTITPAAPSSGGSGTPAPTPSVNSGTAPTSPPAATSMGVDIWVNGRQERIGAANESTIGAKSAITISVDSALLQQKLAAEGNGPVITIPLLNRTSDIVIGELTGQMIKNMEQKNAVIELRTEQATYSVPAQQIRIDSVSQALGQSVSLDDVMIQIEVSSLTDDMARAVANAANAGNFTVEAPSLDFTVRAVYQNRTIPVTTFNVYVERKVVLPAGVDPSKITTGIVVEPNGTVRHVPTRVTQEDNQYFAIINSLSNSAYSVIWHPLEFTDVANHWSKDAVNDMGSRLVVNGTGGELFSPDEAITRAEFAAIIVRGLGLQEETGDTSFTDVSNSAWYGAAVHTANKHGLIQGFADGTFRPNEEITREQAMAILAKAMVITGLQSKEANSAGTLVPYSDIDQLGSWAREAAEVVIQAQIVQGRTDQNLAPKMNMTRAEVAAVIQRLLKVSGLI